MAVLVSFLRASGLAHAASAGKRPHIPGPYSGVRGGPGWLLVSNASAGLSCLCFCDTAVVIIAAVVVAMILSNCPFEAFPSPLTALMDGGT